MALLAALHRANISLVAGTDGSGLEIVRELELYVEAGRTPAEALQTATINPARLVNAAASTGSIALGEKADVVLVDGDPGRHIGVLRHTVWLMSEGRLMNADELRAAAGFTGRPHKSQRGSTGSELGPTGGGSEGRCRIENGGELTRPDPQAHPQ